MYVHEVHEYSYTTYAFMNIHTYICINVYNIRLTFVIIIFILVTDISHFFSLKTSICLILNKELQYRYFKKVFQDLIKLLLVFKTLSMKNYK